MRILEITGEPILHGGQETFIMNCITHMDDADIHFDILTPYACENEYYRALLAEKGGRIFELHLPFAPGKSRKNLLPSVRSFLKQNPYDAVHIHSGSISALAYMAKAAKMEGIRKVIVHSHSTGIKNLKHILIQCAFSRMMKANPTHYCACSAEAGRMKFPRSIAENRLIVLKNGIDIGRFAFNSSKRTELRKKYGIPYDAPVIGHTGRFTYEKNHEFIIEMFFNLLKKQDKARLVLVGGGELQERIRKEVRQRGLTDHVIFTGTVDDIWNYYSMMDVFILPSLYEGFPLTIVEAQASGLPCVLSRNVPEGGMLSDNAVCIDTGNVEEWVSAVLERFDAGRADNASAIEEKGYSIMDTVTQLKGIYREAVPKTCEPLTRKDERLWKE